jgi:hypothetical protein
MPHFVIPQPGHPAPPPPAPGPGENKGGDLKLDNLESSNVALF